MVCGRRVSLLVKLREEQSAISTSPHRYIFLSALIISAITAPTAPCYVAMILMVPSFYYGYVVALGWNITGNVLYVCLDFPMYNMRCRPNFITTTF
jgi:hypothetical protein